MPTEPAALSGRALRSRRDASSDSLITRSVAKWKERLFSKRDAETSEVSNKLYPACKKVLKDLRLLLRVMLNTRFLKHEIKNRQRLYRAVDELLQELNLPSQFADALAILLRPRQCDKQVQQVYEQPLLVFEKLNRNTVKEFFAVECL